MTIRGTRHSLRGRVPVRSTEMQFIASSIFILAAIFVEVTSNQPEVRHVYRDVPRYTQVYYYAYIPVRRRQIEIERLLRAYLLGQLLRARAGLNSPKETTTATASTTTTSTTATTTTTTTTESQDLFEDWAEYEECRYQTGEEILFYSEATADCRAKGAELAHRNVRTAADRGALFAFLGFTPSTFWLPLFDMADTVDVLSLGWLEGVDASGDPITSTYDIVADTTLVGSQDQSAAAIAVGSGWDTIVFTGNTDSGSKTFYVCEYCSS